MSSAVFILEVRPRENPEGEPVTWVLVEKEEDVSFHETDGSLISAEITLRYWMIGNSKLKGFGADGRFTGKMSHYGGTVSLTGGGVFLDPESLRGSRVGTFLMNEVVQWAKQWPGGNVDRITLHKDMGTPTNKERRNRFYEQFGIAFEYSDPDQKGGVSKPMTTDALQTVDSWKQNITVHEVRGYLENMIKKARRAELDIKQLSFQNENLQRRLKDAEDHPIRWAWRVLWYRHIQNLFIYGMVLLMLVGTVYWGFS